MSPTPAAAAQPELDQLQEQHLEQLCHIMQAHTGIRLSAAKRGMIEGRLRRRMRTIGLVSREEYGVHGFEQDGLNDEFPHLVQPVTTNKTDFFREAPHFEYLRKQAVPTLLASRGRRAQLKLWSAACSIGAEAFTMAMVLTAMQDEAAFPFSILGTDIDDAVLQHARRAVYPLAMLDEVPEPFRGRYVMQARDAARDEGRIVPELRRLVQFEPLNLTEAAYPFDRDMDIIFCRNILIYFAHPLQVAVVSRLVSHLRPGGYLVLGHSESFPRDKVTVMDQVAPTIFRRSPARPGEGRSK